MKAVYFMSGLGDIIRQAYMTKAYVALSKVNCKTDIVVASHNPFSIEIFKWHRKREFFHIHEVSHLWEHNKALHKADYTKQSLIRFLNLKEEPFPFEGDIYQPTWYARDDIKDAGEYMVLHPFASGSNRAFPNKVLFDIIDKIGQSGIRTYLVGRDYIKINFSKSGKQVITHQQEAFPELPENVIALDHLSVPATLNLVKGAKGFIGTHSSLAQLAGFEKVKTFLLYPEGHSEFSPSELGRGFTWYIKEPFFTYKTFDEFKIEELEEWMK